MKNYCTGLWQHNSISKRISILWVVNNYSLGLRKIILLCIVLNTVLFAFSQSVNIDSLYNVYNDSGNNYELNQKFDAANKIGFYLKDIDPDSAIAFYNQVVLFAHHKNEKYYEALFLSRIGGAYYVKGIYDKSLEYFSNSLHMWELMGSEEGVIKGLNNVALIYNIVGEHQKALINHKNSVEKCLLNHDSVMLGLNYLNMSIIYNDLDYYDSALYFVENSNYIFNALHMFQYIMKADILKGHVMLKMGEYDSAINLFSKVLDNKEYKNTWERTYALLGLASANQKTGNNDKSIVLALKGLEMATEINALWDMSYASEILSDAYSAMGNFEMAFFHNNQYRIYSDSIYNSENKTRIDYLSLKQKEVEYLLLEEKHKAQEDEIQKKNTQLFMMVLTIIVVLIIIILLFRFIIVKSRLNDQLRQKNAEIAIKNAELTNLNKTKDTLFRIIGHDLRNPVSHIASFTDLILTNYDNLSETDIKEFVKISKESAQSAIDLLSNLLDWARTQTGAHETHIKNVNIINLIRESLKGLENNFKKKQININISVPDGLTANLDLNMMIVILRNLLTNAVKFTPNGGQIKIKANKEDDNLLMHVIDNGVGMSDDKVNSLFNLEKASSTPGTNNEKGIGVGLLLCKDLVEKQGGKIFVSSSVGKGSEFRMIFQK